MENTDDKACNCCKCGKKRENMWYFSGLQQTLCPDCHSNITENTPEYRKWLEDYCPRSVAEKAEHSKVDQYMRQKNN